MNLAWKIVIFGGVCAAAFFALAFLFNISIFWTLSIGSVVITVLVLLGLLFKKLFLNG